MLNLKFRTNDLRQRIREVFSTELMRDALMFGASLIVATGFWFLQRLNDTFEIEIDVPISLVGIPRGVTLTTPLPDSVHVTLRDRGTQLTNYLRHSLHPITLEFALYDKGGSTGCGIVPLSDIHHALNTQVLTSTVIKRISPDTLEFYYNRGLHRRIPVRMMGSVGATENRYIHHVAFSPDSVTVYAPALILDTMEYAYTNEIHVNGIDNDFVESISLRPMRGVKYEPEKVQMTAHVDYYTEKTLSIPIVGVNFPADKILRAFPSQVDVTFRIGAMDYSKVTEKDFILTVSYEELINYPEGRFPLELKTIPEGVTLPRLSPSEFEYLIEQHSEDLIKE